MEGRGTLIPVDQQSPPWLPQPIPPCQYPHLERKIKKKKRSVNKMSANNDSPMIRHFRIYPMYKPPAVGQIQRHILKTQGGGCGEGCGTKERGKKEGAHSWPEFQQDQIPTPTLLT
jgi:hypothetical protein